MDNVQKYKTPQYLNEPYRLIVFTLDEIFIGIATVYLVGVACGFVMTSLALASLFLFMMKRIKGNEGPFYYVHLFYWFFSLSPKVRATPPSWIREFLG